MERAFLLDDDDGSFPGSSFDWPGLVSVDFWDRDFLLWLVDDSAAGSSVVTGRVRLCSREGGRVVGSCSSCTFSSSAGGELPRFSEGISEEDEEDEEDDDDEEDEEEEEDDDDDAMVKTGNILG